MNSINILKTPKGLILFKVLKGYMQKVKGYNKYIILN